MKKYLIIVLFLTILNLPNVSLAVTTKEMMTKLREIQNLEKQIKLPSPKKTQIKKQVDLNGTKNSNNFNLNLKKFETVEKKSSNIGTSTKLEIQKENQNIKLENNELVENKLNIIGYIKQIFRRIFKF